MKTTNRTSPLPERASNKCIPADLEGAFSVLESLPGGISVISEDKTILFMNAKLRRELGDLVGQKCHDSSIALPEMCRECPLDGGWNFDVAPFRKVCDYSDGRTYEYTIAKHVDQKTGTACYVCTERDVTDMLATEAKLKMLVSCFNQMTEPVVVSDTQGRVIYANSAFAELTGVDAGSSREGVRLSEQLAGPGNEALRTVMKDALESPVRTDLAGDRSDGEMYWARVDATPVRGEDGQVLGSVGILRDVTKEVTERQEFENYTSQLEERMQERTEELAKRVGQLTTINKISKDVASILDPRILLNEFVKSIHEGFGFTQVVLMMMDKERNDLCFGAGCTSGPHVLRTDLRLQFREGIIGHAAYYGETLVSGNVQADPRYLEISPSTTKSELAVPVMFRGDLLAVLDIQSEKPEAFTTNEVNVLEMLADMLATALTNAGTYTESKEREQALSVLDRISKQISSRLDATVIMDQVVRDAAQLLKAEKALVGLVDERTETVQWVARYNFTKEAADEFSLKAEAGVTGRAIRRMDSEVVNEYLSDPDAIPEYAEAFGLQSIAVAPLLIGGKSIGAVAVYNKLNGGRFSRTDAVFLSSLADHAAIALENAKLLSSLNQRVASQLALLTTSLALQREFDSGGIYELVADKLTEVVWSDALSAHIIDPSSSMMIPVVTRGVYAEQTMTEKIPLGVGIIGDVARTGTAEMIDDNSLDPRAILSPIGSPDEKESMMVVPFKGRDRVIGIITMYRLDGATFTSAELEVVQLFANQAAVAIENAELYRAQSDLLAESTSKVEQMAKVLELTTSVMYMDDLDKLLQRMVSLVVQSFGFRRASVSLYEVGEDVFVNRALAGYPSWVKPGEVLTSESVLEDLTEENRIGHGCYLSKYENQKYDIEEFSFLAHPELADKPRAAPDAWHERDILMFALRDRNERLSGYLLVDEPLDGKIPTRGLLEALEILAGITSIAVENTKAYEQQVLAANEVALLNDLMTHDINNFNQGIMGYVELLLQDKKLDDAQRRYAEKAFHQVRNNARLIDNVRKLAKVRTMAESSFVPFDLFFPISDAIVSVVKAFEDRKVVVNSSVVSGKYYIHGNKLAYDLFVNIISNAVKFDTSKTVRVDITVSEEVTSKGAYWIVSVSDRGRGIPDDRKQVVFERYASGMTGTKGFGLGLSIVSAIVGRFGGRIWVEDRVKGDFSKGAVFKVRLPKADVKEGETPVTPRESFRRED